VPLLLLGCGALVVLLIVLPLPAGGNAASAARLGGYLEPIVRLSASEQARLEAGEPVTKLLDSDASKEIAVFGAIWIDAPRSAYVTAVRDIERFERGRSFPITKRIGSPPRAADFAALRLSDDDLSDLRRCRVGDCDVKMGETAVRRFQQEIDWRSPDARARAEALFRELMLNLVNGYVDGGNGRLAVYRDDPTPTFVADEFHALVDRMPWIQRMWPALHRFLLDYPRATLPGATDFLYWQETTFGLKPTIRVSHLAIWPRAHETVVASKMLYASHYFWTALELRLLLPDPVRGRGFWFVNVSRSRADGLSGFRGFFIRGRVRSAVENGLLGSLVATRARLENGRSAGAQE
jgi:hypothetical protein